LGSSRDLSNAAREDRSQIAALAACDWIRMNQNVLIHGATGNGKSFLCVLREIKQAVTA
jgi:DNA replication protein DnaC